MDNMNSWYEKKLSKTDVEKKLSVPSRWVGEGRLLPALAAGSEAVPIEMQDEHDGEKKYNFKLTVRPLPQDGSKYYAKPEFRGSQWLAYVKENGLEPGDTVYVWRVNEFIILRARDPPHKIELLGSTIVATPNN